MSCEDAGDDREAEAGATGRAGAGGVSAVEAVKDVVGDLLGHAHPAVAHAACNVGLGLGERDRHGRAIGMLDRVDDEVSNDALDTAFVDFGRDSTPPAAGLALAFAGASNW